jgi:endonuclease/exonuclease/phosphatase family metal-dependent hydrolase
MNLISWNVQWCRGCDGVVNPARVSKVAKDMADVDVLCLQEVARNFPCLPGSAGENQYETLASLFPGYTVIKGVAIDVLAPQGHWREFGNALITRLPILQVYRRLLPWPADASVPSMQRAAIEAVLAAPSGPLRVTTTHLEYYSAKQRAAQVEALRELQAEAADHAAAPQPGKEGGPFQPIPRPASGILTADFNFRAEDPMHARIQAPLGVGVPAYRDAWQQRYPGRAQPPTLGVHDKTQWPGPPFACDFVFVTEDVAGRVEDVVVNLETDASDHQPVLLVLRD